MTATALDIARALIRCPSVTPEEGGALDYMQDLLAPAGFACTRLPFDGEGSYAVDNLFARIGEGSPHLCLSGHTDVVPPGDETKWTYPPFAAETHDGWLYGRGAADMKGGVAGFTAAALAYLAGRGGPPPGSISFLVTGDEEGDAVNGTRKMLEWMADNGHAPDHCLVGEPTCPETLGDSIKIGRRGSLSGTLAVTGTQGHVAYPHLADNPVPGLLAVLEAFLRDPLDAGTEHFAPSNLEITALETGNRADNVIPGRVEALFNIRFNAEHTAESLMAQLREKAESALKGTGLSHEIAFRRPSPCFLTEPGPLIDVLSTAVAAETGTVPELSTAGGTSDARFIKDYCPVIEFGHVNRTIHAVDERVSVADIDRLAAIYGSFLEHYFDSFAA